MDLIRLLIVSGGSRYQEQARQACKSPESSHLLELPGLPLPFSRFESWSASDRRRSSDPSECHREPAIHRNHLARDVRILVAGEPRYLCSNLVRLGVTPQRQLAVFEVDVREPLCLQLVDAVHD